MFCWCCDASDLYKSRSACFDCRKAFKATDRNKEAPKKCPQCGQELKCMSMRWKVPKMSDIKEWQKLKETYIKHQKVEKYVFVPKRIKNEKRCQTDKK